MWWLEKMSKQPGDRLLYGFNIFGLTSKAISIDVHTDSYREQWEKSLETPLVATRSLFVEPHHSSIVQLEQQRGQSGN